jgi:hypothetical protein
MSLIYLRSRPIVAFDENSAEHRRWFAEFVKYRTWGRCPVRFMADSLETDLVSHIEHKMLHYYVTKEFESGKVKSKSRTKSRAKKAPGVVSRRLTVQAKTSQVKGTVPATSKASTKE